MGVLKGDTRTLDYSSHLNSQGPKLFYVALRTPTEG